MLLSESSVPTKKTDSSLLKEMQLFCTGSWQQWTGKQAFIWTVAGLELTQKYIENYLKKTKLDRNGSGIEVQTPASAMVYTVKTVNSNGDS